MSNIAKREVLHQSDSYSRTVSYKCICDNLLLTSTGKVYKLVVAKEGTGLSNHVCLISFVANQICVTICSKAFDHCLFMLV